MIDFGLATQYLKEDVNLNGDIIKVHVIKQKQNFRGNIAFSSKNAFKQKTLSRRDDLISLVYLMLFLITGKYPFLEMGLPLDEQIAMVKQKKKEIKPKEFC